MTRLPILASALLLATPALAWDAEWTEHLAGLDPADKITGWEVRQTDTVVVTAGSFDGTLDLGSVQHVSKKRDIFVARYDTNGVLLGSVTFGGSNNDTLYGLEVDSAGNIYLAGTFANPITFGSTTLTTTGGVDTFVAKLDPNGVPIWAISGGSPGYDYAYRMRLDDSGNILLHGVVTGAATFGSVVLPHDAANDAFTLKLDSNGNVLWGDALIGPKAVRGRALTTDSAGNVYVAGDLLDTAESQGLQVATMGGKDGYVAKYDPNGNLLWLTSMGGDVDDLIRGMDAEGSELVVGGTIGDIVTFGSLVVAPVHNYNIFVAGLDTATGAWLWVDTPDAKGYVNDLKRFHPNIVAVAGSFSGTATFGSDVVTATDGDDALVASYKLANGRWSGVVTGGGLGTQSVKRLDSRLSNDDDLAATGNFQNELLLDVEAFTATGADDAFLTVIPKNELK